MSDGEVVLRQYVIYKRPADFPDGFVVREWLIVRGAVKPVPTSNAIGCPTLEEARAALPEELGLFRLDRDPEDDPTIVEVWT